MVINNLNLRKISCRNQGDPDVDEITLTHFVDSEGEQCIGITTYEMVFANCIPNVVLKLKELSKVFFENTLDAEDARALDIPEGYSINDIDLSILNFDGLFEEEKDGN